MQLIGSHWRSGRQQVIGRIGSEKPTTETLFAAGTLSAILCEYRFKTTTLYGDSGGIGIR